MSALDLVLHQVCRTCGKEFAWSPAQYKLIGLPSRPKDCPLCVGVRRHRSDQTVERKELFRSTATITSLPEGEWQKFDTGRDAKARKPWRLTVTGRQFGASWKGRIDLFAFTDEPPKVGDTVTVSVMEVTKRVRKAPWSRPTLEHGVVSGERQVRLQATEGQVECDALGVPLMAGLGREVDEVRTYVRIEPAAECADSEGRELVWLQAYTKTTLKGLGRQYRVSLSGNPLWKREVSGSARSERFNTVAWLVVVDNDHPVTWRLEEAGQPDREVRYPDLSGEPTDAALAALVEKVNGSDS